MATRGKVSARLRLLCALGLACASLASPLTAAAADAGSAREHFNRGYELAQSGAFEAAIEEFKLAYAASPNFSVLFNLGQAYGASGQAVEAARTLQRFLEIGGAGIDAEQRQRTSELIRYYQRRIGRIELKALPNGARVSLDGQELGVAPFAAPLEASAGTHALSIQATGYAPENRVVLVRAAETTALTLELSAQAESLLVLSCALPAVRLSVDGERVATTPLTGPIKLRHGEHRITLERKGYRPVEQTLSWQQGQSRTLGCQMQIDGRADELARLVVRHPAGTHVLLDGGAFAGNGVPAGAHVLTVAGPGFEVAQQRVELAPRQTLSVSLAPRRQAALLEREREQRSHNQELAAYVVGAGAVLAGGAAAVVAVVNDSRYDDWRRKNDAFVSRFQRDPATTNSEQLERLLSEENSIRNYDAAALGLGIASATLATTAIVLYFTAGKAAPTLVVTPRGEASLGYRAAF